MGISHADHSTTENMHAPVVKLWPLLLMQNPRSISVLWNMLPNLPKLSIYKKWAKPFPMTGKMHIYDVIVFSFPPLGEHWTYMNKDNPSIPEGTMSRIWAKIPTAINAEQRNRVLPWSSAWIVSVGRAERLRQIPGTGQSRNQTLRIFLNAPFLPLHRADT